MKSPSDTINNKDLEMLIMYAIYDYGSTTHDSVLISLDRETTHDEKEREEIYTILSRTYNQLKNDMNIKNKKGFIRKINKLFEERKELWL